MTPVDHQTFRAANDPLTPPQELFLLSKSESEIIRGAVALNSSTPEMALRTLENDRSDHVQECLAMRKDKS